MHLLRKTFDNDFQPQGPNNLHFIHFESTTVHSYSGSPYQKFGENSQRKEKVEENPPKKSKFEDNTKNEYNPENEDNPEIETTPK